MTKATVRSLGNTSLTGEFDPTETPEEVLRRQCEKHDKVVRDFFPSDAAYDDWFSGRAPMDPEKTAFALMDGSTMLQKMAINRPFADQIPDRIKAADAKGETLEFDLTVGMHVGRS